MLMAGSMHDQSLGNKVVLVTGAARRIGAAIVRGVHAAGASVLIHYHGSEAEAADLARTLERARAGSTALAKADLLDPEAPAALVSRAEENFGGLDVLINNASTFYATPLGTIGEEQWRDLLGTNLRAPLFLAQAAAPLLRSRQGTIVNLVDIHARRPLRDHPVYCAAKAGLSALTLSLARDLAPDIRVNAVAPGAILWAEAGADVESREEILRQTCLGRAGDPADIVQCVMYLLAADYVTGQIIAVDGGRSIGW
jgi:pteridine reductase